MRRGLRVAVMVGLVLSAVVVAAVCAGITGFVVGVGMRAAWWHGSVPALSSAENAKIIGWMLGTFAGVLGVELAFIVGGAKLARYSRQPAEAPGPPAPRPIAITIVLVLLACRLLASIVMLPVAALAIANEAPGALAVGSSLPLVFLGVFIAARATVRRSPKSLVTFVVGLGLIALHAFVMLAILLADLFHGDVGWAGLGASLWLAVTVFAATNDSIASYLKASPFAEA